MKKDNLDYKQSNTRVFTTLGASNHSEFEETKNTDEVIQLNLSYDEVLILHYLIMDKINKVASREAEQLTDYLDALKKIDKKIIERWNHGKNIRK